MPADPATSPATSPASKGAVFFRRLLSTVALWGLVILAIVLAKAPLFFLLLGVLGLVAVYEFIRMEPGLPKAWSATLLGLSAAWFATTFVLSGRSGSGWSPGVDLMFLAAVALAAFLPALFRPLAGRATFGWIAFTIMGFVYIPWLSGFLTRILFFAGTNPDGTLRGVPYLLFIVATTKFTDCGAYALGSLIGKHKMIPHISPGKTWEGMAGALLGAVAAGFGVFAGFRESLPLLTPAGVLGISLVIGAVCVVGDLAESIVKRCLGVKDSGNFLPGIGGALDLIDSLLFTAPLFYFYLLYGSGQAPA